MKQEMMVWQWHQLDHKCKSFAPHSRQKRQHLITQFLQNGCSTWRQTNNVKAPKAQMPTLLS